MKIKYIVAAAIFTAQIFALPFTPHVSAAGIEAAFIYDDSPESVTAMTKAADGDQGSSSFASSKIVLRGGVLGDGVTLNYQRHLDKQANGYQYAFNYYCVGGKIQFDKPGSDKEYFKLESSVYFMLEKDFPSKKSYNHASGVGGSESLGNNEYGNGISRVDRVSARKQNTATDDATMSAGGKPLAWKDSGDNVVFSDPDDTADNMKNVPKGCLDFDSEINKAGAMINLQSDQIPQDVKNSWEQTKKVAKETTKAGGDDDLAGGPDCEMNALSPISWIVCPVIDAGAAMSDYVFTHIVKPLLSDVPISTDRDDGGYKVWQNFRVIGNVLLIASLLAVVYSQARGGK